MGKSSRVVRVIRATWHTQKTLFELFQARGGGGLAPESLAEVVQRTLSNH